MNEKDLIESTLDGLLSKDLNYTPSESDIDELRDNSELAEVDHYKADSISVPVFVSPDEDFLYAREKLLYSTELAEKVLKDLMNTGKSYESPRYYEAANVLFKQISDNQKILMELMTELKKIKKEDPNKFDDDGNPIDESESEGNISLTTKQLQELIKTTIEKESED